MTPQEALNILNNAASQVQAVRQYHEQSVTAVNVLQNWIDGNVPATPATENAKALEETPAVEKTTDDVPENTSEITPDVVPEDTQPSE